MKCGSVRDPSSQCQRPRPSSEVATDSFYGLTGRLLSGEQVSFDMFKGKAPWRASGSDGLRFHPATSSYIFPCACSWVWLPWQIAQGIKRV